MSALSNLSREEREDLLQIIQQSLYIERHIDAFLWLNGDVQRLLPHEAMLLVWGEFTTGPLYFDLFSSVPGMRTNQVNPADIFRFAKRLFRVWSENGTTPYLLGSTQSLFPEIAVNDEPARPPLHTMHHAAVHGIRDMRDHHDCLYVALHSLPNAIIPRNCRLMEILLPYIDTALRQVVDQPWRCHSGCGITAELGNMNKHNHLSARELEIMEWVRKGKTNQEIAMILNISVFTVKNHLQRIFKKLDVMNRAQAVASIVEYNGYARG